MLRITDNTNVLQGLTLVVGSGLSLTEDANGLPKIDVVPAASGTTFESALNILAFSAPGGHKQLRFIDRATETLHNWMFGTAASADDIELTPSTTVGGTTFSNPIMFWKATGDAGMNTRTPGGTKPSGWDASSSSRGFEVAATGAHSSGVFLRRNDATSTGFDVWHDSGTAYLDVRGSSGVLKIRVNTASSATDAVTIDASNNTTVLGSSSSTGKLKANRFILPVGTNLWAT